MKLKYSWIWNERHSIAEYIIVCVCVCVLLYINSVWILSMSIIPYLFLLRNTHLITCVSIFICIMTKGKWANKTNVYKNVEKKDTRTNEMKKKWQHNNNSNNNNVSSVKNTKNCYYRANESKQRCVFSGIYCSCHLHEFYSNKC